MSFAFALMRTPDLPSATACAHITGAASWTEDGIAHDELAIFRLRNARSSVSSGSLHGLAAANRHSRAVHGLHK